MSNLKVPIAGFTMYRRGKRYDEIFEMIVPIGLHPALLADDERKDRALEQAEASTSSGKEDDATAWRTPASLKAEAQAKEVSKSKEAQARAKEQEVWDTIVKDEKPASPRTSYRVFDPTQAVELHSRNGNGDDEDRERLARIYRQLVEINTVRRPLASIKSFEPLEVLMRKQPHMKEVVRFVIEQLQLANASRKPVRLQPMLLVGEPGIGKTHFAQGLAAALATTVYVQQLDTDVTLSLLLGSDRKWRNSQHGVLFEQVVLGKHANPIIVLDEIDKVPRNVTHGSPLNGLYSVLESLSARRVRDISLMFEFDVSQVTWLATANDVTMLEPALRSRFREFHIQPPDAQECLVLAEEVMRAAIASVDVKGFSTDVSIKRHLAHLPARQIWQLTLDAIAKAVAHDRKHLVVADLPAWLFESYEAATDAKSNWIH